MTLDDGDPGCGNPRVGGEIRDSRAYLKPPEPQTVMRNRIESTFAFLHPPIWRRFELRIWWGFSFAAQSLDLHCRFGLGSRTLLATIPLASLATSP